MIKKISEKVWKFTGSDESNCYFLDLDEKTMIDAGYRADRQQMLQLLGKVVDFDEIKKVIFTHLHYDHIGNFDLFPNAEFFASAKEIADFNKKKFGTILSEDMVEKFNVDLKPIESTEQLEIIESPGHTKGSICIWFEEEKVLFTGDTMFAGKKFGRVDLPTSAPELLQPSLLKLVNYNYKVLAPGHDY
ncbi:MBL fold metallo-hydrolase [Candidatus Woesearchaeota archaeon]|nr:MBL fold metallo-hydrolase [Candidatus Woesearchaeota archaeon]